MSFKSLLCLHGTVLCILWHAPHLRNISHVASSDMEQKWWVTMVISFIENIKFALNLILRNLTMTVKTAVCIVSCSWLRSVCLWWTARSTLGGCWARWSATCPRRCCCTSHAWRTTSSPRPPCSSTSAGERKDSHLFSMSLEFIKQKYTHEGNNLNSKWMLTRRLYKVIYHLICYWSRFVWWFSQAFLAPALFSLVLFVGLSCDTWNTMPMLMWTQVMFCSCITFGSFQHLSLVSGVFSG